MYFVFFFKQKTAYEMRISDWSSDVCSSDLRCTSPVRSTTAEPAATSTDTTSHLTGPNGYQPLGTTASIDTGAKAARSSAPIEGRADRLVLGSATSSTALLRRPSPPRRSLDSSTDRSIHPGRAPPPPPDPHP